MAIIVEGQLPYTAGDGIEITANKVIKVLLREENNLIKLNEDNELYTDLQLVSGITPSDEFPVGVTVGQVLKKDGWLVNGTILNFQTTSGDYGRWLYGADGHMYYDHGTGTFTQIYSGAEVDDLFTQLRGELSTVAFTGDYNDLKNRPEVVAPSDGELTISKNGEPIGTFTANQATDETIDIEVPTTVAELEDASDYAKTADLSTVATTGDYDDLLDKPTIGDATITIKKNNTTVDSFTTNATSNKSINITVPTTVAELTDSSDYVTDTELSNALADYTPTANLAAVALSNDYDDLDDKPTIGDATLTIQKNGTTVNSIKMNATTDVTANIVVPTDTSDLTNNAGFVTNQVNDTAYGSSWDGDTTNAPSKNAVYDKIQTVVGDINTINGKIPSAASSSNQLTDKNYVDSSINSVSAYYITKNAAGDQFATYAELSSATTFYSGGVVRTPTRNDYTIVLADETHDNEVTRYIYNSNWEYQYSINESPMTQAQLDAINSGITSSKVTTYDGYATGKQATLVSGTNIKTINNTSVLGSGNIDTNQVSDTAYASSWNGSTTTAPSQNAVYDKINAMDTTISGKADSSSLATVATSGSYADLSNKPTIGSGTLTLQKNGTAIDTFSANATANKTINVTVPTKTSDLTNDSNFVASTSLATVATSGSYADLSNKPTIDTAMSDSSTNAVQNKVIKSYVDTTAGSSAAAKVSDTAYASSWNGVTGIAPSKNAVYDKISAMDTTIAGKADSSSLATVATSGSYADLTNKPTIPTVPTNVSAFNNDSGYLTSATGVTTVNGSHGAVTVQPTLVSGTNIKTINSTSLLGSGNIAVQPTISDLATIRSGAAAGATAVQPGDNVSDLTNDAGYITNAYHDSTKQDTLTAGENIKISSNVISANNVFIITEADVTVSTDDTKGVAPYNTSYGYTNIDISANAGIEWREGAIYTFVVDTEMVVASAYRNVRVKIGNGAYIPVMGTTAALAGHSYFTKANIRQFQYTTKYESGGALHLFTDSNTTYSAMSASEATTGTSTSARSISASVLKGAVQTHSPVKSVNGQTGAVTLTIPTVNNGTLTINQGGTSKGTFTANQSGASTVNLETGKLVTQTEYNNISGASSDGNLYIIYKTV